MLPLIIYSSCAVTNILFENFDTAYLHTKKEVCSILLPWLSFVPFFAVVLVVRVIGDYQIRNVAVQEKVKDTFGISSELSANNITAPILLISYLILAQFSMLGKVRKNFFADCLFILFVFTNSLIVLVAPATRVVIARFRMYRRQRKIVCYSEDAPSTRNKPSILSRRLMNDLVQRANAVSSMGEKNAVQKTTGQVSEILKNEETAKQFRRYAQKFVCAENVDFLLEVQDYKKLCASMTSTFEATNYDKQELFSRALSIIFEFVSNESSSQVKFSREAQDKLLLIDANGYSAFIRSDVYSIFDSAQNEIEQSLQEGVLPLFLAHKKLATRFKTHRKIRPQVVHVQTIELTEQ